MKPRTRVAQIATWLLVVIVVIVLLVQGSTVWEHLVSVERTVDRTLTVADVRWSSPKMTTTYYEHTTPALEPALHETAAIARTLPTGRYETRTVYRVHRYFKADDGAELLHGSYQESIGAIIIVEGRYSHGKATGVWAIRDADGGIAFQFDAGSRAVANRNTLPSTGK